MRFHQTWVVVLVFGLAIQPVRATDWAIDVVPCVSAKEGKEIRINYPFYVVLSNVTDHDLTVWQEWCSWGYYNLFFEFTGKDGNVVKVSKMGQNWSKNFPDPFIVGPGRHFVLEVTLSPQDWVGTENLNGSVTVKAIYKNTNGAFLGEKPNPQNKIPDDMQKMIDSAWVGQVESEPMQVTLAR